MYTKKCILTHSLSQASILAERGSLQDETVLKGGMVTVDLRYVQTKSDRDKGLQGGMGGGAGGGGYYRPAKVERWADSLMSIVSDNFEVQCFKQRRRGATEDSPARQSVVFYGLLVNCQLAGYAYMVAFGRIHALSKAYAPPVGEWEAKQSAWGGGVGGTRLGSKVRERERERERESYQYYTRTCTAVSFIFQCVARNMYTAIFHSSPPR